MSRVDAGQLLIDVVDRRPLTDAATVHDYSDTNRLPGKTILVPRSDLLLERARDVGCRHLGASPVGRGHGPQSSDDSVVQGDRVAGPP